MTAITFSPSSPMRHRPAAAQRARAAGSKWRVASAPQPAPTAALRLTRRGRLVITGLLASVAIVASMFIGGVGFAGTAPTTTSTTYVTVEPGQTLWQIAGTVAPSVDRRDTVQRILELNALQSANVRAGQRIAVPAS